MSRPNDDPHDLSRLSQTSHQQIADLERLLGLERERYKSLEDEARCFHALFERAGVGIEQVAPDGRLLKVNQKLCDLLGLTPGELSQLTFRDITHPDDLAADEEQVRRLLGGTVDSYSHEKRYLRKDGSPIWVQVTCSVVRNESGQPLYRISVVQDITERRRGEEALRESEARFRAIFDQAAVGISQVAPTGRFLQVNQKLCAMLGYAQEELLHRTFQDITHPDDLQADVEQANRLLAGETTSYSLEKRYLPKNGSPIWVLLSSAVVCSKVATPLYRINVVQDITERKHAEQERLRLEAQIQHAQKLESLGVLAGGIAHDFNNLLTGILGNASMALADLRAESPAYPVVQQIETAALRAADLTKQLLAYSGKGRFVIQRINLSRLVEEMANLLMTVISKRAVLRFDFASNLPAIQADATQVRQVVMNLITNASDAIGEKSGVITLRTGVMNADETYLASTYVHENLPSGYYVYFEVADNGCGMDEATLHKIFDPFFTTKFTGRGLGLAAVLGIVRGHRGTIKVYSELKRGSTFKVLFPCEELGEGDPAEGFTELPVWRGQGTILVIDDEETVRVVIERALRNVGFGVILACDGREGLTLYRQRKSEIVAVVLDLTMPHMNGEEVFRELRLLQPDVRVILMSGYNEQEVVNLFAGKGLAGFMQKPFRVGELFSAIQRTIELP